MNFISLRVTRVVMLATVGNQVRPRAAKNTQTDSRLHGND